MNEWPNFKVVIQNELTFSERTVVADVCAKRHRGNSNSRAANLATDKERDTARILEHLAAVTDATCDEVEVALGMPHQTCSARFSDMKRAGEIVPTVRRATRTGSMAQAWKRAEQY